jgi:UDP-N-acetylglucosamine 1-carboxyvinyltransferase
MHVNELVRLGANIQIDGKVAVDRRAWSALWCHRDGYRPARVGQPGDCRACGRRRNPGDRIYHLDRGYDQMEAKLRALGADIERVK